MQITQSISFIDIKSMNAAAAVNVPLKIGHSFELEMVFLEIARMDPL